MKSRRIVVTGSSGMVGSNAIATLLRDGFCSITAVVRSSQSCDKLSQTLSCFGYSLSDIKVVIGDIAEWEFCLELAQNCDILIHTAAEVSFDPKESHKIAKNNINITENIVAAAVECSVSRFIHISSIATLSDAPYPTLTTENNVCSTIVDKSPYSMSKFFAENIVWRAIADGLNATILMPSVILGGKAEENNHKNGSAAIAKLAAKASPFYSDGFMGYVSIDDVSQAIVLAVKSCVGDGNRYILCSENLSFREIIDRSVAKYGGRKSSIKIPTLILKLIKRVIEMVAKLGFRPKIAPSLIKNLYSKSLYDGSNFCKDFDFRYTPILKD